MKTRVCPTKQNRASLVPSQASSSNPPVGQSNASRSDLDINLSENLTSFSQGGAVGLGLASLWAFGLKKQETVQHYI